MNHKLNIRQNYLNAKLEGNKLFEIRFDDRGYQKGDFVTYEQYSEDKVIAKHMFEITYVSSYMQKENYVVFGEKYIGTVD